MRLLRFGPSLVFVRSSRVEELVKFLRNFFGINEISADDALRESSELDTIIVPTSEKEWKTFIEPSQRVFLIRMCCDSVLKELFNSNPPAERINLGPHIILFRVPSNIKRAVEILKKRYGGEEVSLISGIEKGEERDTLLVITEKKLSKPVGFEDIKATLLFSGKNFVELYHELRTYLPIIMYKVLPEGFREITIKLYDTAKRYDENVERLLLVLEDLDLGYAVNEGWGWDYPRPLMRVKIYKVKLLTWEKPERVKFLLKGLEYRGYRRLCDIDVFVDGKRISWTSISKKYNSKFELAKAAREELERLLSEDVKKKLHKIEAKLLQEGAHQQK
ncbi:hypothetical protein [Thermococcus barophilus]|uniref:Uncharacterized protein n=1 Tax=Thermococcus barophilus TaxID=55802 RepID=A0A0S1XFK3_THEBA|nr:hypothetical protein [Thermococcus barophilus]ALM76581.1 hypothetical protein TBCH5v1_2693 [Thermococcus barophilus]